jgi:phage terminase large subunit-like protein
MRKAAPRSSSSRAGSAKLDPVDAANRARVEEYIDSVTSGRRVVGKRERQAVERHIRDLEHGPARGLNFDEAAALRVLRFCGMARHYKGKEFAGKPFVPSPWEAFIAWCSFGWRRADGLRRFRQIYIEVAKKNGKSFFLAVLALYLLIADGEAAAEVYSAATKRDQAKIVWGDAVQIIKRSPDLKRFAETYRESIVVPRTASKFVPLGADADTLDGLNVHGAAIDEVHAHKDRHTVDQLVTATASREQPLVIYTTTAGWNRNSICWEKRDYGCRVLDQVFEDDEFFAYIAALDDGDDWKDEKNWPKANPNLGISVKLDTLRSQAKTAQKSPAFENNFKRYRLNVWTSQVDRVIPMEAWDECGETDETGALTIPPVEETRAKLKRAVCWGGLDLSSTQDITALILEFPDDEDLDLLAWFWIPEDTIPERVESAAVPYDVWKREGWLESTPGNVIDYRFIRAKINEIAKTYEIRELAYDPYNAQKLVAELTDDGVRMVEFPQRNPNMAPPTKDVLTKILAGKVKHHNNPVLRWMASNVASHVDAGANLVFSKKKSAEKIDGMIAWVMAHGRAITNEAPDDGPSRYSQEGAEMFFV